MNFLLDTNVISEWVKPRPNLGVIQWLADVDEDRVFISAITLAELRYGIERLATGARRKKLETWFEHELLLRFEGRVLPVTNEIANAWGRIVAHRESVGRPIGIMDAFLAATANIHDLALVTHNTSDFRSTIKDLVNPWNA